MIKFFKSIIASKDKASISWLIRYNIFDYIMDIFLNNDNKKNLLHSCILSLFDLIVHSLQPDTISKLLKKLVKRGYADSVFLKQEYMTDFSMIYRQVQVIVETQSEHDSKQRSDRDRSFSQS